MPWPDPGQLLPAAERTLPRRLAEPDQEAQVVGDRSPAGRARSCPRDAATRRLGGKAVTGDPLEAKLATRRRWRPPSRHPPTRNACGRSPAWQPIRDGGDDLGPRAGSARRHRRQQGDREDAPAGSAMAAGAANAPANAGARRSRAVGSGHVGALVLKQESCRCSARLRRGRRRSAPAQPIFREDR